MFGFPSPLLWLYTHSSLCWLKSLIPSIPHRQVVCFIEIKLIIFPACTQAPTASYTFTRYYLPRASWLRNTLSKLKVGKVPEPDIMSRQAFFFLAVKKTCPVSPVCQSVPKELSRGFKPVKLSLLYQSEKWSRRWAPQDDFSFCTLWWETEINCTPGEVQTLLNRIWKQTAGRCLLWFKFHDSSVDLSQTLNFFFFNRIISYLWFEVVFTHS